MNNDGMIQLSDLRPGDEVYVGRWLTVRGVSQAWLSCVSHEMCPVVVAQKAFPRSSVRFAESRGKPEAP